MSKPEMITCPKCQGRGKRMWAGCVNSRNGGRCFDCNDKGVIVKPDAFNVGTLIVEVYFSEVSYDWVAKIVESNTRGLRHGKTREEAIKALTDYCKANNWTGTLKIRKAV